MSVSDIVLRLRDAYLNMGTGSREDLREAADEIERLREAKSIPNSGSWVVYSDETRTVYASHYNASQSSATSNGGGAQPRTSIGTWTSSPIAITTAAKKLSDIATRQTEESVDTEVPVQRADLRDNETTTIVCPFCESPIEGHTVNSNTAASDYVEFVCVTKVCDCPDITTKSYYYY